MEIVDIERDEGDDEITRNLMPMVRDYLNFTEHNDYVYDLYFHDTTKGVSNALEQSRVGTLEMDTSDPLLLDEGPTDSDVGDSDDSNAEDYYTHDYPDEEELSDENQYAQETSSSDEEFR